MPAQGSRGLRAIHKQLVAALRSENDMLQEPDFDFMMDFFHQHDNLDQKMYRGTECGSGSYGTVYGDKAAQVMKTTCVQCESEGIRGKLSLQCSCMQHIWWQKHAVGSGCPCMYDCFWSKLCNKRIVPGGQAGFATDVSSMCYVIRAYGAF